MRLDEKWQNVLESVGFSFFPVVNPQNGELFGVEALVRGYEKCGFASTDDMFDDAYRDGALYDIDLELRKNVFAKFIETREYLSKKEGVQQKVASLKLFYNIDTRILEMVDCGPGNTKQLLKSYSIKPSNIYFDISERHKFSTYSGTKNILNMYKLQGFRVAIDDFGSGRSGFELLYHSEPNAVKIDKHLIRNINANGKNRLFCAEIIKLARIRGALVIAEGIETKEEFYAAKELGFDLVQGFFIQKPSKPKDIEYENDKIKELAQNDKRQNDSDAALIKSQMLYLEPSQESEPIQSVVEKFQKNGKIDVCPIIDKESQPQGIITEKSLRKYIYSQYGLQIIQNQALRKHTMPCPIADIKTPIEDILDLFANYDDEIEGVIITQNFRYAGFLSAKSLINALNEKNLKAARDQNPLTKLPGNRAVTEYIDTALGGSGEYIFAYIDLDNFKPFNDKFGFRQGDRAIMLFADTIKRELSPYKPFIGHIGGDDFFVGYKFDDGKNGEFQSVLKKALIKFAQNAESFYAKEDRKSGYITAKDRFGTTREFPLLSASCACVTVNPEKNRPSADDIVLECAELKKEAKSSPEKFAFMLM